MVVSIRPSRHPPAFAPREKGRMDWLNPREVTSRWAPEYVAQSARGKTLTLADLCHIFRAISRWPGLFRTLTRGKTYEFQCQTSGE